jgi:hypothetical protein
MMDETEEEALFTRLRGRLGARSDRASLLADLDAERGAMAARIEASVARATAGLRADLDRLEAANQEARRRRPSAEMRRLGRVLLALALVAGVGFAAWLGSDSVGNGLKLLHTSSYAGPGR